MRIQIVVCPELSDEYRELDALSRELRPEKLPRLAHLENTKEGCELPGDDWGDTIFNKNHETLIMEGKMIAKRKGIRLVKARGLADDFIAEGRQEVLSLLRSGVPLAEVEKQLQLA